MAREIAYRITVESAEAKAEVREFNKEATAAGASTSKTADAVQAYEKQTRALTATQSVATASVGKYEQAAVRAADSSSVLTSATQKTAAMFDADFDKALAKIDGDLAILEARHTTTAAATAGLGTQVMAAIDKFSLYAVAAGVITQAFVDWYAASKEAELATVTAAQRADDLARASAAAGRKISDETEAQKELNKQKDHRMSTIPTVAAQQYFAELARVTDEMTRQESQQKALEQGLAAYGWVLGGAVDLEKQFKDGLAKSEEAMKRLSKARQEEFDRIVNLNRAVYDLDAVTLNYEDTIKSLQHVGMAATVDEWRGSYAELREEIAALDRQASAFGLEKVGTSVDEIDQVSDHLKKALDQARRDAEFTGQIFQQMGQRIGGAMGDAVSAVGQFVASARSATDVFSLVMTGMQLLQGALDGLGKPMKAQRIFDDMSDLSGYLQTLGQDADGVREHLERAFAVDAAVAGNLRAEFERLVQAAREGGDITNQLADLQDRIARTDAIADRASQFGPTRDELAQSVKDAYDTFLYMQDLERQGQVTHEQTYQSFIQYQKDLAAAGDTAAAAWLKTNDAAAAGATKASEAMQGLLNTRKSLEASLAQEAPEEFMGSIERQQREQLASVNTQIEALDRQSSEAAEGMKADFASAAIDIDQSLGAIPGSAEAVRHELDRIFSDMHWTGRIDIVTAGPEAPEGPDHASGGGLVTRAGIQYLSAGGPVWQSRGIDTVPAMLAPGEGVVNRSGMRRLGLDGLHALNSGASSGGGGTTVNITIGQVGVSETVEEFGRKISDTAIAAARRRGIRFNAA